jgi:hypothetical protein
MAAPYPMTRLQFSLALAILGAVGCNGTIGDSIGLGSTGTGSPLGGPSGGLTSGAEGSVGAGEVRARGRGEARLLSLGFT